MPARLDSLELMMEPCLQYSQRKLGFPVTAIRDMPWTSYSILLTLISILIRCTVGAYIFETHLKKYPHFTTPLIEMREMKEMFFNYR